VFTIWHAMRLGACAMTFLLKYWQNKRHRKTC